MFIVIGYFPVVVTLGINTVALGFSPFEAILSSMLIFAGASQFVLISTMGSSFVNAIMIPLESQTHSLWMCDISKAQDKKTYHNSVWIDRRSFRYFAECGKWWTVHVGNTTWCLLVVGDRNGYWTFGGSILASNKMLVPSLVFSLKALFFILLMVNLEHSSILSALLGGSIAILQLGYTSLEIMVAGILSPIIAMKIEGRDKTEWEIM